MTGQYNCISYYNYTDKNHIVTISSLQISRLHLKYQLCNSMPFSPYITDVLPSRKLVKSGVIGARMETSCKMNHNIGKL